MNTIRIVCKGTPTNVATNDKGVPLTNKVLPTWSDLELFIDDKPISNVQGVKLKLVPGTEIITATVEFVDVELDVEASIEAGPVNPIPMILTCPRCTERHIDEGEFATKAHHTHVCQSCGLTWRPAKLDTIGVQFLPGYQDEQTVDTEADSFVDRWADRLGLASRSRIRSELTQLIKRRLRVGQRASSSSVAAS